MELSERDLSSGSERYLNPNDIIVPPGYRTEVFAQGLDFPVNMIFLETGDILIGESGLFSGVPRILLLSNGIVSVIAEGFFPPLTGITYYLGEIYVAHNGFVTAVSLDGSRRRDILTGLPSKGDFANNRVEFGPDNRMYFGIGTTSNSGIIGPDNRWVNMFPLLNDFPGTYVLLKGQNYYSDNMLVPSAAATASTGAFAPYAVSNIPFETRKGIVRASGSIVRANPDGTNLELVAWGFRNPVRLKFSRENQLFVANQGYDIRGSRPIANASDDVYIVSHGIWYGWPDFSGGIPVNSRRFTPEGGSIPELLLAAHPNFPPRPFASFIQDSTIMGFDFDYYNFGNFGDIFIAEFGSVWPKFGQDIIPNPTIGHKVSRIDSRTGGVTTFAINRSGFPASFTREGGFGWPSDVVFGPDRALYVLDFATNPIGTLSEFIPDTGVIWRISKDEQTYI